jgi:energy-coupling factor transporter transmembrane protein EcfT
MIRPFQEMLGIDSGLFFFAWIIPMTIIIFILGTIFVRFFLSLPRKVKMLLFLSAFIFLLGAIGIEMISGAYWQANNFVYNMNYRILNAIEEGLENFGSIIAIYALIVYTKGNNKIIKKII